MSSEAEGRGAVYFISHAFADDESLGQLLRQPLPDDARAKVLPAVEIASDQLVSTVLMPEIKASDGLIYIRSPRSVSSFWVAFERNYALRLGKPVYAYHVRSRRFVRDTDVAADPTLSLVWNLYAGRDSFMVRDIALRLAKDHCFEVRGKRWKVIDNNFRQMVDSLDALVEKLSMGGLAVVFLSNDGVCCGGMDSWDPWELRRANLEMLGPPDTDLLVRKFAFLSANRPMVVWLDQPDPVRIESAIERMMRPMWDPFIELVRGSMEGDERLVVVPESVDDMDSVGLLDYHDLPTEKGQQAYERLKERMLPRVIDEVLVRATHLAFKRSPAFRDELSSAMRGAD